jgi:Flp pilus assembly protein TadB
VTLPVLIWILVAAGAAILVAVLLRQLGPGRRARAVRELLDAADALEAKLRAARAENEAVAGEQGPDPVGEAMREMLRQRLWLRDHGREASLAQLAEVRSSIDAARGRIEAQLAKIARARAAQI